MDTRFKQLGVAISHDIPEDLCVEGFPDELRQVFTNLLTNAAEAHRERWRGRALRPARSRNH